MHTEHLYSSEEKLKWWGSGKWVEEPDCAEFIHMGILCKIHRVCKEEFDESMFGGHFCGYAQVPTHIVEHFDKIILGLSEVPLKFLPHGGITYSKQKNDGYWVGFDCAHSRDLIPSLDFFEKKDPQIVVMRDFLDDLDKEDSAYYRDFQYVLAETKLLAEQLAICAEEHNVGSDLC